MKLHLIRRVVLWLALLILAVMTLYGQIADEYSEQLPGREEALGPEEVLLEHVDRSALKVPDRHSRISHSSDSYFRMEPPCFIDISVIADKTSPVQGNESFIYDVQWVSATSTVIVIISKRIPIQKRWERDKDAAPPSAYLPSAIICSTTVLPKNYGLLNESSDCLRVRCRDVSDLASQNTKAFAVLACKIDNSTYAARIDQLRRSQPSAMMDVYFPLLLLVVEIPLRLPSASRLFRNVSRVHPPKMPKNTISVCIAGVQNNSLPILREVVQTHLTAGMQHIYLGAYCDAYQNVARVLKDFIAEGFVSVVPLPYIDLYHRQREIIGDSHSMGLVDDYAKNPFINSCVYYSKSWDDFTAVLDIDEIIIPVNTTGKLIDVLNNFSAATTLHPTFANLCYISLEERILCKTNGSDDTVPRPYDSLAPNFLLGESFRYSFRPKYGIEKSIVVNKRINWAWIHDGGCDRTYVASDEQISSALNGVTIIKYHYSNFQGLLPENAGGTNKFPRVKSLCYGENFLTIATLDVDYVSVIFPKVKKALTRRGWPSVVY